MSSKISRIVASVLKNISEDKRATKKTIVEEWRNINGEAAKHSKPVSMKKGRLVVIVDGSSWLYKMTLEKEKIKKELNKVTDNSVEDIIFRVGKI